MLDSYSPPLLQLAPPSRPFPEHITKHLSNPPQMQNSQISVLSDLTCLLLSFSPFRSFSPLCSAALFFTLSASSFIYHSQIVSFFKNIFSLSFAFLSLSFSLTLSFSIFLSRCLSLSLSLY